MREYREILPGSYQDPTRILHILHILHHFQGASEFYETLYRNMSSSLRRMGREVPVTMRHRKIGKSVMELPKNIRFSKAFFWGPTW